MRNLAGDVLQVVCPRAADGDGIVQRESTVLEVVQPRPCSLCEAQDAIGHFPLYAIAQAVLSHMYSPKNAARRLQIVLVCGCLASVETLTHIRFSQRRLQARAIRIPHFYLIAEARHPRFCNSSSTEPF
jgi:hypothetical protein